MDTEKFDYKLKYGHLFLVSAYLKFFILIYVTIFNRYLQNSLIAVICRTSNDTA